MRFLDRSDEMHRLDGTLRRQGSFAVIWGRRRVGKSRLLIEWSRRHEGLYTVADQSAPTVQRRYLAAAVAERFPGFAKAAVDALVLDPAGPLHGEPDRLLLEETPPATALRPLLDTIGAGVHRVSEIAGRLGRPASSLSRPLASLIEMQFV